MQQKLYRLPDKTIDIIHDVMKKTGFKSEVDTIIYIVNEYQRMQELPEEVVKQFNEVNGAWMERLRWACQSSEQNSYVILDVINTLMFEKEPEEVIPVKDIVHPVISQSQDILKARIAHFKQRKDNKKNKEKI